MERDEGKNDGAFPVLPAAAIGYLMYPLASDLIRQVPAANDSVAPRLRR